MTSIALKQNSISNHKLSLIKKLERLKFEKKLIQLHNQIQIIEDKLGEKTAINYLKGYLEDHGILMRDFIKTMKNI